VTQPLEALTNWHFVYVRFFVRFLGEARLPLPLVLSFRTGVAIFTRDSWLPAIVMNSTPRIPSPGDQCKSKTW
jgi:hypothetical protein